MPKCCDINPGLFRTPIIIERMVKSQDALGGEVVAWETARVMRARVRQLSGGERWFHDRIETRATDSFDMYYVPGLDETMRIKKGDTYFNIRSINNVENLNRYITITAERGIPQ